MTNGEQHLVAEKRAEMFVWDDEHTLKLYLGEDSAAQAELEASHITVAARAGLNVPVVKEIVEVNGRCGIIFEQIEGPTLREELVNKPHRLIPLARTLAEVHFAIHACSAPAKLGHNGSRLREIISAAPVLTESAKDALLADLVTLPSGHVLCHGDFHPGNLYLTDNGPVIANWLRAAQGNQHMDIAHTVLRLQPTPLSPEIRSSLRQFTIATVRLFCAVYLQRYAELGSLSFVQVNSWQRIAAVLQLVELGDSGRTLMNIKAQMMAPTVEALR